MIRESIRRGIYRIVYDMTKSDLLITEDELDFMDEICSTYDIDTPAREAAMQMSLAQAMQEVQRMTPRQSQQLVDSLLQLTTKDGTCYREEALLLLALRHILSPTDEAQILSLPHQPLTIDADQVLFIENGYHVGANEQIMQHYVHLLHTLRIAGFDFIYIPQMVRNLAPEGSHLLHKVVTHLTAPRSQAETEAIVQSVRNLTTERVFREILLGRLGFDIHIDEPALLLRISQSEVNGDTLDNYLVIRLHQDITPHVDQLVDGFLSMLKSPTLNIRNVSLSPNAFIYSGFYRVLFDLITLRRGISCQLHIYPHRHGNILTISQRGESQSEELPLEIGPKESAFYIFLIEETLQHGGFNIAAATPADLRELDAAQLRFQKIYFQHCNRDQAPDITCPEIRRPMLSKIRRAIQQHPSLIQQMMFIPEVSKHNVIRVHVERRHIIYYSV